MHTRRWRLVKYLALGIVVAILIAFANAILEARRSVALTMHSATAFKLRHAFQMHLYFHDTFPPRIAADSESNEQVSWRMLLQFAEDGGQSDYRRDEPWNSDHNLKYLEHNRFVVYFSDSIGRSLPIPTTTFVAVSDLQAILTDERAVRPDEVADGPKNTLLVAQVPQADIPWPVPRDLTFEEFCRTCDARFDASSIPAVAGYPKQLLLFADGGIFQVVRPLPLSDFKAIWTHSADDGPDRDSLVRGGYLVPDSDRPFDFGDPEQKSNAIDSNDAPQDAIESRNDRRRRIKLAAFDVNPANPVATGQQRARDIEQRNCVCLRIGQYTDRRIRSDSFVPAR